LAFVGVVAGEEKGGIAEGLDKGMELGEAGVEYGKSVAELLFSLTLLLAPLNKVFDGRASADVKGGNVVSLPNFTVVVGFVAVFFPSHWDSLLSLIWFSNSHFRPKP
jgi:hypothetical protein